MPEWKLPTKSTTDTTFSTSTLTTEIITTTAAASASSSPATATVSAHADWPTMPMSFAASPMRWVLTGDPRNCSGLPCPVDTYCMRPEPFLLPNYCVHKQAMQDVPELLVKGPGMIYCEEIGQAVLALVLLMIFVVQFAHLIIYYWRSKALVHLTRQNAKSLQMTTTSSSMDTELRPLMMMNGGGGGGGGHTNLTYEQSATSMSTAFEPSYIPFQQV